MHQISNDYYYPRQIGDFEGNVRYKVVLVRQNEKVTFIAEVGDNRSSINNIFFL